MKLKIVFGTIILLVLFIGQASALVNVVASNTIQLENTSSIYNIASSPPEYFTIFSSSTTPITINGTGTYNFSVQYRSNNNGGACTESPRIAYITLYKNNISISSTQNTTSTSYVYANWTITGQFNTTDVFKVLLNADGADWDDGECMGSRIYHSANAQNFRLMYEYADGNPTDTWFHGNYGYTNGELLGGGTTITTAQLASPQGTITKTNGGTLSNVDSLYFTVAGTSTNDTYQRYDFTIYNVNYTNSINISVWGGFSGSAEAFRLGLLNGTTFTAVKSETGTSATHLTTYTFSDTANLSTYSVLDTTLHKLTFSVLVWTYGNSAQTMRVDKVQAIVDYDQIPPPLYYDFPDDPDSDLYRSYSNYTTLPVAGAPVVASAVQVNIVPRTNKTSAYDIPLNGLVGWWHNDDSLNDSSGNNYNLTWNGESINYSQGEFNNGSYFNGINNSATAANSSILDFERTDAFSIVRWIKINSLKSNEFIGGKRENAPNKRGYSFYLENKNLSFAFDNYTQLGSIMVTRNVSLSPNAVNFMDGQWHLVAITYDGSSDANGVVLYVDNQQYTDFVIIQNNLLNTTKNPVSFAWGSRPSNTVPFLGWQDEGMVYDRVLTYQEISNKLYKQKVEQLRVKPDDAFSQWSSYWNNYTAYTGGDSPINFTVNGAAVSNILFDVPQNYTQNGIRINDFQRLAWFNVTSFVTEAEGHPCFANETWADACSEAGLNTAIANVSGDFNQTIIVAGDISLSSFVNITRANLDINLTSAIVTTNDYGFYSTMNNTTIRGGEIIVNNVAIFPSVYYGIWYNNVSESSINDVIVRGGNDGIKISGIGYNNMINNNSVYNQSDHGIYIRGVIYPNEEDGYFIVPSYCANDLVYGNYAENQSGHRARAIASEIVNCITFDSNTVEGNNSNNGLEGTYFGIMAANNWELTGGYGYSIQPLYVSTMNITIKNSVIHNVRKEPIWAGQNASNITFLNNYAYNDVHNWDYGMDFDGVTDGLIENNTFVNGYQSGIVTYVAENYHNKNITFKNSTVKNPGMLQSNSSCFGIADVENAYIFNNICIIDNELSLSNISYFADDYISSGTINISNNLLLLLVGNKNIPIMETGIEDTNIQHINMYSTQVNNSSISFLNYKNRVIGNISYNNVTDVWNFSVNGSSGYLNTTFQMNPATNYGFYVDSILQENKLSNSSGYVTFNYTGVWSQHTFEVSENDVDAPASVTENQTATGNFWINNSWTNPVDADFNYTMFKYSNGTLLQNVSNSINYLNRTLSPHYTQNISAQTVDASGNINSTKIWFNATIPNNAPIQSSIGNKQVTAGQWMNFSVNATDADNDTITYGTNASKGTLYNNLLKNNDMENWSGGDTSLPDNYSVLYGSGAGISKSTKNVSGVYSANLTASGAQAASFRQSIVDNYYYGKNLTFGAWVWSSTASSARLFLSDGVHANVYSSYHSGGSDWEYLTVTANIPVDAITIDTVFTTSISTSSYFDSVSLKDDNGSLFSWRPTGADVGTYYWNFNSSDGYGGVDDETITVTVNAAEATEAQFTRTEFFGWD